MSSPIIAQLTAPLPAQERRRTQRVLALLAGILLLSIGDLVVTLAHLRTIGMVEANPIAAYLIRSTGSAAVLVAYKCVTVVICISLLYLVRRSWEGEAAAWCAIAILVGMTMMWHSYSEEISTPQQLQTAQAEASDAWLRLD